MNPKRKQRYRRKQARSEAQKLLEQERQSMLKAAQEGRVIWFREGFGTPYHKLIGYV
jgi:hypothetical protein